MSNRLLSLVWGTTAFGNSSRRIVMAALADHANKHTEIAFPGIDLLQQETELGRRTLLRSLGELEADGWITVDRKVDRRRNGRNSYRFNSEKLQAEQRLSKGAYTAPMEDEEDAQPVCSDVFISAVTAPLRVGDLGSIGAKSIPTLVPEPTSISAKNDSLYRSNLHEPPRTERHSRAKREPDPRHVKFKGLLDRYWRQRNRLDMPWGRAEAGQMGNLLKANPTLDDEAFAMFLENRLKSDDVTHSERPCVWLANVTKYANGPLDRFNKPKGEEHAPGSSTARENPADARNKRYGANLGTVFGELRGDRSSGAADVPDEAPLLVTGASVRDVESVGSGLGKAGERIWLRGDEASSRNSQAGVRVLPLAGPHLTIARSGKAAS